MEHFLTAPHMEDQSNSEILDKTQKKNSLGAYTNSA